MRFFYRVPADIFTEFLCPVPGAGFRGCRAVASWVSMPKAAVDEDGFVKSRKDKIGCTGQVAAVEAKAIP